MMVQEEKWLVATSMERFGGSFVSALGTAIFKADPINTQRIYAAFLDYWEQYLAIAKARGLEKEIE